MGIRTSEKPGVKMAPNRLPGQKLGPYNVTDFRLRRAHSSGKLSSAGYLPMCTVQSESLGPAERFAPSSGSGNTAWLPLGSCTEGERATHCYDPTSHVELLLRGKSYCLQRTVLEGSSQQKSQRDQNRTIFFFASVQSGAERGVGLPTLFIFCSVELCHTFYISGNVQCRQVYHAVCCIPTT